MNELSGISGLESPPIKECSSSSSSSELAKFQLTNKRGEYSAECTHIRTEFPMSNIGNPKKFREEERLIKVRRDILEPYLELRRDIAISNMGLDFSGLEPATLHNFSDGRMFPEVFQAPSFQLPPVQDIDGFEKAAVEMVKPVHGTTTLAFIFKEGIIVAADSRASMGQYISSQSVKKILEINPYLLGTMAGGAADCQFWQRNLGTRCRLHELANKRRISVAGASKLLANTLYSYRGMGLSMGTMIAGWDETGPGLFYVDSEGGRIKGRCFSVGSGSPYAYGILDSGYKEDMTVEEAAELGRRAIYHATFRDGASGGVTSVYYIGPQGWKKLSGDDVSELHYKYYPVPEEQEEHEMAEA